MKCNDRNRQEKVGAQFIGASPIHRPGVGVASLGVYLGRGGFSSATQNYDVEDDGCGKQYEGCGVYEGVAEGCEGG